MNIAAQEMLKSSPEVNLFHRFIRGGLGLAKTYWLYNVLVGFIIIAPIQWLLQKSFLTIQSTSFGTAIAAGFEVFVLCYSVLATIALWRSANLYRGRKLWPRLVKGTTVLGWLLTGFIYGWAFLGDDEDRLRTNMQILSLNQSLPVMVDSNTRLDRISIESSDIVYSATLVHLTQEQVARHSFEERMFQQIKLNVCNNKDTQQLFENNYNMVYRYSDKVGVAVGEVNIKAIDCKGSVA